MCVDEAFWKGYEARRGAASVFFNPAGYPVNLGFGQLPLELHAVQPGHPVKSAVIGREIGALTGLTAYNKPMPRQNFSASRGWLVSPRAAEEHCCFWQLAW